VLTSLFLANRHAGYSYSGPAAAFAYRCIDIEHMYVPSFAQGREVLRWTQKRLTRRLLSRRRSKRVFILGPSHHVYLDGCALSKCKEYETPIGSLPLDLDSAHPPSRAVTPSHTRADSGDDARSDCRAQGDGQV